MDIENIQYMDFEVPFIDKINKQFMNVFYNKNPQSVYSVVGRAAALTQKHAQLLLNGGHMLYSILSIIPIIRSEIWG